MFLINSCQGYFRCGPFNKLKGQALFQSYGCFFAEFLEDLSLVRLGLLALTTCVGLRYDLYENMHRRFSRKHAPYDRPRRTGTFPRSCGSALKPEGGIFLALVLRSMDSNPITSHTYYAPSLHRSSYKSRNINRASIGCGICHPLRID